MSTGINRDRNLCFGFPGATPLLVIPPLRDVMGVTDSDGDPPRLGRALTRFLLAFLGTMLGGVGFWWTFIDREALFLHDRLAGTRIVRQQV